VCVFANNGIVMAAFPAERINMFRNGVGIAERNREVA
jgi:hypothetical protein